MPSLCSTASTMLVIGAVISMASAAAWMRQQQPDTTLRRLQRFRLPPAVVVGQRKDLSKPAGDAASSMQSEWRDTRQNDLVDSTLLRLLQKEILRRVTSSGYVNSRDNGAAQKSSGDADDPSRSSSRGESTADGDYGEDAEHATGSEAGGVRVDRNYYGWMDFGKRSATDDFDYVY